MKKVSNDMRWFAGMLFLYTSNYPYTLKQGAWVRPSVFSIQYSVIQFFFKTLTWMKGLKTRKKGIGYFVMHFLLLYYIIYIYIYRYIDSI